MEVYVRDLIPRKSFLASARKDSKENTVIVSAISKIFVSVINSYKLLISKVIELRRNPPGLRVVVGQNYVPKLFTPYCKLFVLLLQISYQKKSFLTTPNIENQSRSSAEFH